MGKLIVHIGGHKTGSTSIQKFMFENEKYFRKEFKLYYPIKGVIDTNSWMWGHHFLTWYFTPIAEGVSRNDLDQVYDSFLKFLEIHKGCDILISSEDFVWNHKVSDFISEMKKYFDEIIVIIYIRNQVDAAVSLFQTAIVNKGYSGSFGEWFKKGYWLFDYPYIIKKWENEGCKVIIRPFLREKFIGKDVIFDFIAVIDSILKRNIKVPDVFHSEDVKVNITVPDFITKMIHYYNKQDTKEKVVPLLRELGQKIIHLNKDIPTMGFLPSKTKAMIRNRYVKSNFILCDEYIGMDYLDWLNKEITENEQEYIDRFGYPGSQLAEFSKYMIEILNKVN